MKRQDFQSLGDVLRQTLSDYDLQGHLDEVKAASFWTAVVGPDIASQCGRPWVEKGVLKICVRNASLRQELSMSASTIVRLLNTASGTDAIHQIRFLS